jgi:predicted metal-dependent peptidase
MLSENFFEQLNEFSIAALVEHELLHIVLQHCLNIRTLKGNKQAWNIAFDAIINDAGTLISQKDKLCAPLQQGIFLSDLNLAMGTNLTIWQHTSKDVFDALIKNEPETKTGFDEHFKGSVEQDDGLGGGETEAMQKLLEETMGEMQEELEETVKAYGKKSQQFEQISDGIIKSKKNLTFNKAIQQFMQSKKAHTTKPTWKKTSRRFGSQFKGKVKTKKQRILLALDTSGSMMNDDTIAKMKSIVAAALAYELNVDLIAGDTELRNKTENLSKTFDFSTVQGGGGTELSFMFKMLDSSYDGIVVFTDGYFNHEEIPVGLKSKILFALTEQSSYLTENFKTIGV